MYRKHNTRATQHRKCKVSWLAVKVNNSTYKNASVFYTCWIWNILTSSLHVLDIWRYLHLMWQYIHHHQILVWFQFQSVDPSDWKVMSSVDMTNQLSVHVVFLIQTADQSLIGGAGRWVVGWDCIFKKAKQKKNRRQQTENKTQLVAIIIFSKRCL